MPVQPSKSSGDYQKMGMGQTNLYVVYTGFTGVFTSLGVAAACIPLFMQKNQKSRERVAELALKGFGPAYLAYGVWKFAGILIGANLGTARRETGINVPDQHAYKAVGKDDLVLMDDDGANGRFNRAQRSLANVVEVAPSVLTAFLLNMQVFPKAAAACLAVFSMARVQGALGYTADRTKRMQGNMLANVSLAIQEGMIFVAGVYATYLEYK